MSVNSSLRPPLEQYHITQSCLSIFTALTITHIALLPLFILVVYVGYKQWRKQRSVATATTMSHSDVFTFHMVALEIIGVLGSCFNCYGLHTDQSGVTKVGFGVYSIASGGQTLFHLLTCVERYLAVVHPITYVGLRQVGGVRIRNISIGCAWLICLGSSALTNLPDQFSIIYGIFLLVFSFIVASFCSLSVLYALIRPGPGDQAGRNRDRVDQSKRRALITMMAITGALLLRFSSRLVSYAIFISSVLSSRDLCLLLSSSAWFNPPSSLVLPLLFLHRAGKLPGCKHNTESN